VQIALASREDWENTALTEDAPARHNLHPQRKEHMAQANAQVAALSRAQWWKQVDWWLLLVTPLSVGVGVVVSRVAPNLFHDLQLHLEVPAPYLMILVAAVYVVRAARTRSHLHVLLAALAVIFALREFHWDWMHHSVYYMLAALGGLAAIWGRKLAAAMRDWRHTSWVMATFTAYVLSQMIARRAFRSIPGEHEIHRSLEEWAETTAHLMFLVTALVGSWRAAPTDAGRPEE